MVVRHCANAVTSEDVPIKIVLLWPVRADILPAMASTSEARDRYANKVVSIGDVPLVIPPPGEGDEELCWAVFCCADRAFDPHTTPARQMALTIIIVDFAVIVTCPPLGELFT